MNLREKLSFLNENRTLNILWPVFIIFGGILLISLNIFYRHFVYIATAVFLYTGVNILFFYLQKHFYNKKEEELHEQSLIDSLTGLKNMRYFDERIKELTALYDRQGKKFAVIFFDLNNFKKFNDKYGHTTGDKLLQKIADFLEKTTRSQDSLIRYGGDEFILLSPDVETKKAQQAASRIISELCQHTFKINDKLLSVEVSGGIAVCPENGTTKEKLLEVADRNLYQAKEQGTGVVCGQEVSDNHPEVNSPIIVGEKNDFIRKEEKKSTEIYLLAKHGDLEIIRQTITADKVILFKGEQNIFEYYYILSGTVVRDEDEKEFCPDSYITVQNTSDEMYFKTKTECTFIYITTSPMFASKQEEIRELLSLNEKVRKKDKQTRAHSSRLEKLSMLTGQKLGLDDESLFKLDYAALLHDVGKVNVESEILGKNGSLNDREWENVENHPEWGKELISKHLNMYFFEDIAEIVHQHHEYYDGSGYPRGLKGEEIMKEAQILTVVDAYDAMTSDRPYRNALPREEAIKELKSEKGKQFSPEVVDAFLEVEKELYGKLEQET